MLTAAGTDSLWLVLAGAGVIAAGIVTVMSQMMDLALGTVPVEKAGTASSVLETGAEFGGALGMALLGSIGTAVYRHDIPDTAPDAAHETLGAALAVARQLPGRAGDALVTAAREAFTSGMQAAAVAGALLLLGAAVLAAVSLRQVRVRETESPSRRRSASTTGRPAALPIPDSGAPPPKARSSPRPWKGARGTALSATTNPQPKHSSPSGV